MTKPGVTTSLGPWFLSVVKKEVTAAPSCLRNYCEGQDNAGELGAGAGGLRGPTPPPSSHLPPRPIVLLQAGSEQAPAGSVAPYSLQASEQAFQLPGDSLTGTEPLPRHGLQPQGIMSKRTWGTGLKCHWSHSPKPPRAGGKRGGGCGWRGTPFPRQPI